MLQDLTDDLKVYNAENPREAEDGSEEEDSCPAEDSLSTGTGGSLSPPDAGGSTHQAPGFDLITRARAWVDQRKTPADGGGGEKHQAFNKV